MNTRAYSVLDIKSVDEEKRLIEGIATTPNPDRMGDVVVTEGIEFKLPIPLLYQHDAKNPIGSVTSAKVQKTGITIKAQIAPAGLDADVDRAWQKIKNGLVRGLSIGFRTLEESFDKTIGGFRILKSEWLELSAVTIPANADATITSVKSFDEEARASHGNSRRPSYRLSETANPATAVALPKAKSMTIKEQIAGFENKRAALSARRDEIENKLAEETRSADQAEREELNTLDGDIDGCDEHLDRLRKREARLVATAKAVAPEPAADPVRNRGSIVTVKSNVPASIAYARMAIAMWHAKNNHMAAAELCKQHWPDQPELQLTLRAIVEAADTTTSGWASQLLSAAQQLSQEFIDMYRAQTIIGRIPGLRNVPFNVAVPLRTAAGTFQWVGEAAAKPVTSETFDRVSLLFNKIAAITVITKELARFSSPAAEGLISESMRATIVRAIDTQFVSSTAAVSGVSPAGILNSISAITPTGTTPAAFRTDMFNMLNNFTANSAPLGDVVLLMSETQALGLSMMVTDLGVPLYPTISTSGGTIFGRPVVVSEAVGTKIIGLRASDILIAQDPGVTISVSDQATIEMETTPAAGEQSPPTTQSVLKSMFQNNCLAILCEQFITWTRSRTSAVEYINGNAYVPS